MTAADQFVNSPSSLAWTRDHELAGKPLTPRQLETLKVLVEAGDRQAAADQLGVSYWTVRNHLFRAFRKLDVDTAIEAYRELGWLRVPETRP